MTEDAMPRYIIISPRRCEVCGKIRKVARIRGSYHNIKVCAECLKKILAEMDKAPSK